MILNLSGRLVLLSEEDQDPVEEVQDPVEEASTRTRGCVNFFRASEGWFWRFRTLCHGRVKMWNIWWVGSPTWPADTERTPHPMAKFDLTLDKALSVPSLMRCCKSLKGYRLLLESYTVEKVSCWDLWQKLRRSVLPQMVPKDRPFPRMLILYPWRQSWLS
jgi:hypothetical protein